MKALLIHTDAIAALDKIPKNVRQTLMENMFQLASNPAGQSNNVKSLKGRGGDLRMRVGDWRIIFRNIDTSIHIVDVGPRGGIYDDERMEKMDWQATVKQAHKEAAAAGIGSNSLERIQDAAEEAYDILCVMEADLRAVLGAAEYVPFSLAQRRFAGESPITIWREHRGMTQKALAAKVKMTAAQLSEIEKGKKSGSIATLRKLSIALGVTVDDLLPAEK